MVEHIGKYKVLGEMGAGAFGRVYRAYDPVVNRPVAIKVLNSDGDAEKLGRFVIEAQVTGNLAHPNIVTVFEKGEHEGKPYLVMELLDGQTFQQIIQSRQPLNLIEKMAMMLQVAEGLNAAHHQGVVHRDIKPANIMLLTDGSVKIMDFGIARATGNEALRPTRKGDLMGTILYMAPEQFRGQEADELTDIFSFGVVYYELLTGRHPFPGNDAGAVLYSITVVEPEPLTRLLPEIPELLERAVGIAIAKDRELRYQSLEDLILDTQPVLFDLKQTKARSLAAEIAPLMEAADLEAAQAKIKQVLDLDRGNAEARRWRDTLQDKNRREVLGKRVDTLVSDAETKLAERSFQEAIQLLETAIKLDKTNQNLSFRLETARAAKDAARQSARLVAQARRDLSEGNLAAAFENISEAVETDPGNAEAANLREEIERQQRETRLKNALLLADAQRANNEFDAAVATLLAIEQEHRGSAQVRDLRNRVETERVEAARRLRAQQFKSGLNQARFAVRDQRLSDAEQRLEALCGEFPEEPAAADLLTEVRGLIETQRRVAAIEKINQDTRILMDAQSYLEARRVVDEGLRTFANDTGLRRLRDTVNALQAARERAEGIEAALHQGRDLGIAGKLDEAWQLVSIAIGRYGADPNLAKLQRQLQIEREEAQRSLAIREILERGRKLLAAGETAEAISHLEQALARYSKESEIASLLTIAKQVQADKQEREFVARVLSEVAALDKGHEWLRALHRVERALGRYPRNSELKKSADRLRATLEEQEINQILGVVRKDVDAKDWVSADASAAKALQQFPENEALKELDELIRRERLAAEKRAEGIGSLNRNAQALIRDKDFSAARHALAAGIEEFSHDTGLQHLLEMASDLEVAHKREQGVARVVDEANTLAAAGKLDEAIQVVATGSSQFEGDSRLIELSSRLEDERKQQAYQAGLKQALSQGQVLLGAGRTDDAIAFLEPAVNQYSNEKQLSMLLDAARQAQTEQIERQFIKQALADVQDLGARQEWQAALLRVEGALGRCPDNDGLLKSAESIRERLRQAEHRRGVMRHQLAVQEAVEAKDWKQALTAANAAIREFPNEQTLKELAEVVRKHLRQAEIDRLAARVHQSLADNDLDDAARQLSATRTVLGPDVWQKLQAELESRRAYQNALDEAQDHSSHTRFSEAEEILRNLIDRQPPDTRAAELLANTLEARQRHDRAEQARHALEEERRQMIESAAASIEEAVEAQDWARAGAAVEKALERFPTEETFLRLKERISRELSAQQRAKEISVLKQQVQAHIVAQDFAKARNALESGLRKFPEDPELPKFSESVNALRIAHERSRAIAKVIEAAETLAAAGKHDAAIEQVVMALGTFANDGLLTDTRRRLETERERLRREDLERAFQRGQDLLKAGQLAEAVSFLDRLVAQYPDEGRLAEMLASARRSLAEQEERERREKRREEIGKRAEDVRLAVSASDWKRAGTALDAAIKEFPGEQTFKDLAVRVRQSLDQADLEQLAVETRGLLARDDAEGADGGLERSRKRFGKTELWKALQSELKRHRAYAAELEKAQQMMQGGLLQEADDFLRGIINQRPLDNRAADLLEKVRERRRQKEKDQQIRSARESAGKLSIGGDLAGAVALLAGFCQRFPEDTGLREDYQKAQALLKRSGRPLYRHPAILVAMAAAIAAAFFFGFKPHSQPPVVRIPPELPFKFRVGGVNPAPQSVELGRCDVAISVKKPQPWLSTAPRQVGDGCSLEVTVDPAMIPGGPKADTYHGEILVSADGSVVARSTVSLLVEVPTIRVDKQKLAFTFDSPREKFDTLRILQDDDNSDFTVKQEPPESSRWLKVMKSNRNEVRVRAFPDNLKIGQYSAWLILERRGSGSAKVAVTVNVVQ